MHEFIVKYWLEFLFGTIIAIGGFFGKKIMATFKEVHKSRQKAAYEEFQHKIHAEFIESTEDVRQMAQENKIEIKEMKQMMIALTQGVLSMHGREFKNQCWNLLEEDHEITLEEYEDISADHEAYNALGGNHEGDRLFDLVQKKFEKSL